MSEKSAYGADDCESNGAKVTASDAGRTPSSEELAAVPNPHAKAIWHTRSACPWCRAYDEAQRLLAERQAAAEWVQMHRAWGVLDD